MNLIYDVLALVRKTASKNEKIEILTKYKDTPGLPEYLAMVYDPQTNYYIKKVPEAEYRFGENQNLPWEDAIPLLGKLSSRFITGNDAKTAVAKLRGKLSEESDEMLCWALARDVKAGIGVETINKVWDGLIFVPPYQRCSTEGDGKQDKWDWKKKHYVQLKADGMFVNLILEKGFAKYMTRGGNVLVNDALRQISIEARETLPEDSVTTGELLVCQKGEGTPLPRTTGNGILNSLLHGEDLDEKYLLHFVVWDIIPLVDWYKGNYNVPYSERWKKLVACVADERIQTIETKVTSSVQEAKDFALEWMKDGQEGAILKNADGVWKDHTSPSQVKIKAELDVDLIIKAMTPGNGKNKDTFGSLTCESSDGKLAVDVSGLTDKERQYIKATFDEEWKDKVCVVKANQLLSPGKNNDKYSLFLPRFVEKREDKHEGDDIERIISIFKPYQPSL